MFWFILGHVLRAYIPYINQKVLGYMYQIRSIRDFTFFINSKAENLQQYSAPAQRVRTTVKLLRLASHDEAD